MEPFEPVRTVADLMRTFRRPWWIAGGWAIDLFLDRETRDHGDVEIAILRGDQWAVRDHLREWRFQRVTQGTDTMTIWSEGERIEAPDHEVHAQSPDGSLQLEILLNEGERDTWRFRRNTAVARPLALMGMRSADGVPFLAPEVVLLYKAKDPQARDYHDFRVARSGLDEERREWLRAALRTCHPGHPWIDRL